MRHSRHPAHPLPPNEAAQWSSRQGRTAWVIAALAMVAAPLLAGPAAKQVAPPPVAPPPTLELKFVKSAFVNIPGEGKDPFFPKSARRQGVVKPTIVEGHVEYNFLTLKGISGSKNRRLAIINNRTFEVGEEAEMKSAGQVLRVRCLEIRDDGVTVSINGQTQKLFLGPKQ